MLTLLALAPVAHAWLGDDGTYRWSGSGTGDLDAPVHEFVDVPNEPGAVMLSISVSDDAVEDIGSIGTGRFRYYGVEYSLDQIQVSTNGLVLFQDPGQFLNSYCCAGQPIPAFNVAPPAIFPFWTDLNPSAGGEIWAVDTGSEVIIHFQDVAFFGAGGANTVQVGLRQDGSFRISTDAVLGGNMTAIGNQRDGNRGNQVFFGTNAPASQSTVLFVPDPVDDDGDGFADVDDCDDTDPDINPGVVDDICDGVVRDCSQASSESDNDGDGYLACGGDCDDSDFSTNPDGFESCDGRDNDCNGAIDDGIALETFYIDTDFDGWGDVDGDAVDACFPPVGYAPEGDCDDTDFNISPFASEDCDPVDRNCDGDPTANAFDAQNYRPDADGDGYGTGPNQRLCELPADAATNGGGDCDDADPTVNPGATETPYDDIDQNCDGYEERDRDDDGMSDADEYAFGSNWLDEDTDDDGVLDPDEFIAGSDPTSDDTDADGVLDGVEIALGDSDGDGTDDILDPDDDADGWDTLTEGQGDFDEDSIPNYLDTDSDGDGILDVDETADGLLRFDADGPPSSPDPEPGCGCAASGFNGSFGAIGLLSFFAMRRR